MLVTLRNVRARCCYVGDVTSHITAHLGLSTTLMGGYDVGDLTQRTRTVLLRW